MNQQEKEDHVVSLFGPGLVFTRDDLIKRVPWAEQQIRVTLRHLVLEGRIAKVGGGRNNGLAQYAVVASVPA